MIDRPLVITIDGPAGVGKSTVAKRLAKRLGLLYVDTGATYRTLAYAALLKGVDLQDARALVRLADSVRITLQQPTAGLLRVRLDGRDVTRHIRTERVTEAAAVVAQHPQVRDAMVRLQRRLARRSRLVIEGRDTGTVVFPRASHKFFLTAKAAIRARRRQRELRSVQGRAPSLSIIVRQLRRRDGLDLKRTVGPLVKPVGAVVVDTSSLTAGQVVSRLLHYLPYSANGD